MSGFTPISRAKPRWLIEGSRSSRACSAHWSGVSSRAFGVKPGQCLPLFCPRTTLDYGPERMGTNGDTGVAPAARERRALWPPEPLRRVPASGQATAQQAARLRHALLGELGPADPIRDIAALCSAAGCRLEEKELRGTGGGLQALLIPVGDRFEVVVDARPPARGHHAGARLQAEVHRHRLRFRVAHELAHTLFFQRIPKLRRRVPNSLDQERFCDEFAAELLVPSVAARACRPSGPAIVALHRRFDVSLEVAGRSVAAAQPELACWLAVLPRDGSGFLQWRSKATYRHEGGPEAILALAAGYSARRGATTLAGRLGGAPIRLRVTWLASRRQAVIVAETP